MFRLLLAVLVVFHHGIRAVPFGVFAVCTFFILSGYWVTKMYAEFYTLRAKSYWVFILSRAMRILPLYWLCSTLMALISWVVLPHFFSAAPPPAMGILEFIGLALLLPLNLLEFKLLNPAWSLAVEMQYYLIAPFLVILTSSWGSRWLTLLVIFLTGIFAFVVPFKTNEMLLPYLVYFYVGMVIYTRPWTIRRTHVLTSLLLVVTILVLSYTVPLLRQSLLYKEILFDTISYYSFLNYLLPFFFVPFIVHNVKQPSDTRDRSLGDFSYTVYLFHWIVFALYYQLYPEGGFNFSKVMAYLIALILVALGSAIIYTYFERPVEGLRRSFTRSTQEKLPN